MPRQQQNYEKGFIHVVGNFFFVWFDVKHIDNYKAKWARKIITGTISKLQNEQER